jgi:nifR3 family TIM-barrel protein
MNLLPKDPYGCPYLQLAPMEGVGDDTFRKAITTIGGFDEAVRDFLRVPRNGYVPGLIKAYDPDELSPIPLACQLMGSEPQLMAEVARGIEQKGAPRIDINCGCPSNTVTGKGAGSSLLKDPNNLFEIASAVVKAVSTPVTLKMRSGYEDTSLFRENLLAAQESGVRYITLHPRTKVDGYGPPARWDLIAEAKKLLRIPLVGNGDILTVEDALKMLETTHCDALMIGRGSLINPFLFHQIKARFSKQSYIPKREDLERYLKTYVGIAPQEMSPKSRVNKLKQLLGFIFKSTPELLEKRQQVLVSNFETPSELLTFSLSLMGLQE